MSQRIERYVTRDGTLRAAAVVATPVIEEARQIHESSSLATAALGRALLGAGLMASFLKDEGRIALQFKGNGPLGQVFAEGDRSGQVRGFIVNPQVDLPRRSDGKLDVGSAIGKGVLTVSTITPPELKPYTGTVDLQSGEVAEDIAYYLYQSHQIPSIVALGIYVGPDLSVQAAGGLIIQVMPGATESTIKTLEDKVKVMKPVTELIRSGAQGPDLVYELFDDFEFKQLENSSSLVYKCKCNIDKVERALLIAGPEELDVLIKKATPAEVKCDFCGRKYGVPTTRLQELLHSTRTTK